MYGHTLTSPFLATSKIVSTDPTLADPSPCDMLHLQIWTRTQTHTISKNFLSCDTTAASVRHSFLLISLSRTRTLTPRAHALRKNKLMYTRTRQVHWWASPLSKERLQGLAITQWQRNIFSLICQAGTMPRIFEFSSFEKKRLHVFSHRSMVRHGGYHR